MHPFPTTDPGPILRYRDGQYAAELLATGLVHLDFFSWLASNPGAETQRIQREFELSPRPADVALTLFRAQGFIRRVGEDGHELTPLAREHLVRGSPWFLGPYYEPLRESPMVLSFLQVLRTGKPANWHARQDGDDWHKSMLSEEFARRFTELMHCRGLALGQALARATTSFFPRPCRVLDVGGGSGIYSIALALAHQGMGATLLEQSPVDEIARRSIAAWNLSERIKVVCGDMFSDAWPVGHDVHLLSNVLHDWDLPEIRRVIQRSAESLRPGGLLVIHEAFLNDSKTGPLAVAEYSALLMHATMGRCYSPREYGAILTEHGFEPGPYQDTIADRGFMTAVRR
jgi:predicted O-methyltransferase YrrM